MYEDRNARSDQSGRRAHIKKWLKRGGVIAGVIVGVVGIFTLGMGVGNGTIRFSTGGQGAALPNQLDYSSVDRLYRELKSKYDGNLDKAKLLDGVKSGLVSAAGDPYTLYFNAAQAKDFDEQLSGTFSGIGAELGKDADGNLIVVSPIEGTPASKAGIRPQDIIVEIDGKSTAGLAVDQAVGKIRGEKGTQVKLRLLRDKKDDLTLTITRDEIKVPSVKSEILDGNIGYLRITQFNDETAGLAKAAATKFADQRVKGIVVDLRSNPGGLVDAAVDVTSLWLPENKTVLVEKRGNVAIASELSNGIDPLNGIPTVVLVNEGSASAAEIMAGALKDNKAATIMGVKSFGKGSVQQLRPLPDGSELKVTIARWYRPNGENIDKKGISPDTEVKMTNDDFTAGRDPQKDAALQFLKQ